MLDFVHIHKVFYGSINVNLRNMLVYEGKSLGNNFSSNWTQRSYYLAIIIITHSTSFLFLTSKYRTIKIIIVTHLEQLIGGKQLFSLCYYYAIVVGKKPCHGYYKNSLFVQILYKKIKVFYFGLLIVAYAPFFAVVKLHHTS